MIASRPPLLDAQLSHSARVMKHLERMAVMASERVKEIDLHPPIWRKHGKRFHDLAVTSRAFWIKITTFEHEGGNGEQQSRVEQSIRSGDSLVRQHDWHTSRCLSLDVEHLEIRADVIQSCNDDFHHVTAALLGNPSEV